MSNPDIADKEFQRVLYAFQVAFPEEKDRLYACAHTVACAVEMGDHILKGLNKPSDARKLPKILQYKMMLMANFFLAWKSVLHGEKLRVNMEIQSAIPDFSNSKELEERFARIVKVVSEAYKEEGLI